MIASVMTMICCRTTCMMSIGDIAMTEVMMTMTVLMTAMEIMWMSIDMVIVAMCASIVATRMIVTCMGTMIMIVDAWHIVIEMGQVMVDLMDTEQPTTSCSVDRTEEIIQTHESAILYLVQDITKVIIAPIQIVIVAVDSIIVTINYSIHNRINRGDEVIVDLIAILILLRGKIEFVCHTIAQETSILTNFVGRKCKGLHYCGKCQN